MRRGIFEGKVATFWCILHHSGIKLFKVNFWDRQLQFRLTTAITLLSCVPTLLCLWMKPSRENFLVSQLSVCMSFFLFSMQVHEKQILSPLLIYTLCATNNIKASWLYRVNLLCTTSLFSLMWGDNADEVFLYL